MAIKQLTDEQVQSWTVEQKDRWWLENVFRGDIPQFTLRTVVCGFLLGGILSITNLYVGAKTGWSLGVGITSVILAYVVFKTLEQVGLARQYDVLENNIMQSIATAAGYMTSPLTSSLAAYMMVTHSVVPIAQTIPWLIGLAVLGVLFAFPLKRRFINEEQHPFPEGRAAGVVMDTLHAQNGDTAQRSLAPQLLLISGVSAAILKLAQAPAVLSGILRVKLPAWLHFPEFADGWLYKLGWHPAIMGVSLKELTIRPELDIAMFGAGGLMGIRTGISLMVGAIVNYAILAPIMIQHGDIRGVIGGDGAIAFGFRPITEWALWGGVAMMTTASLMAFFAKPGMIASAFTSVFAARKAERKVDPIKHIELPLWVSLVGIPIIGAGVVYMAHTFFGVPIIMGVIAVPLVFVFTLIAAHSTALTSITPIGAMGKITQLTYGVLAPGQINTNLITAGITGEVSAHASNLMMNIKPGYMLGAKPRLQAIGHCVGALSGALFSAFVFEWLFLRGNPDNLVSAEYPFPSAAVWRAVAEILTEGIDKLPVTAIWAAGIGAALGIVFELIKTRTKGRFPLSGVGMGLAFVIPFTTCLAMSAGAFVFWLFERGAPKPEQKLNRVIVQNQEAICAGIIAGAALMGIAVMAYEFL